MFGKPVQPILKALLAYCEGRVVCGEGFADFCRNTAFVIEKHFCIELNAKQKILFVWKMFFKITIGLKTQLLTLLQRTYTALVITDFPSIFVTLFVTNSSVNKTLILMLFLINYFKIQIKNSKNYFTFHMISKKFDINSFYSMGTELRIFLFR